LSRQGKARERTVTSVKEFWNAEAREWGSDPRVTIRDHHFRLLSISTIRALMRGRRSLLDAGCGSGFSTLFYAEETDHVYGIDIAEAMIEWANRFLNDRLYFERTMREYALEGAPSLRHNVIFELGDILHPEVEPERFDAIVAERVLINLPTIELQEQALSNLFRLMSPGGRLALVEVTQQGHAEVDRLRLRFGLDPIEKYWHNLYIDEGWLEATTKRRGLRIHSVKRFETYQFLTKVLHPAAIAPEEPTFMCGFNNAARLAATRWPGYREVEQRGLDIFFDRDFARLLEVHEPYKLERYRQVASALLTSPPDFSDCSHQVLFVIEKD
jgi:SAM-dependent methyltransferase